MISNIVSTIALDTIDNYYCILSQLKDGKCPCEDTPTLTTNPDYKLITNGEVGLSSFLYGYVYGKLIHTVCSDMSDDYIRNITSAVARIMCAFVMPNIHRRANVIHHALYYMAFYIGSDTLDAMSIASLFTSIALAMFSKENIAGDSIMTLITIL